MLRRTFLGILAAIPFVRKENADRPQYRVVPMTGSPTGGEYAIYGPGGVKYTCQVDAAGRLIRRPNPRLAASAGLLY